MEEAIPVECKPVQGHPTKVRLIQPEGAEPAMAFTGWFNRYHLAYAPGEGFSNCGEYVFYYHTVQHYTYGVCRKCGEVYVKPWPIKRPAHRGWGRFMEETSR